MNPQKISLLSLITGGAVAGLVILAIAQSSQETPDGFALGGGGLITFLVAWPLSRVAFKRFSAWRESSAQRSTPRPAAAAAMAGDEEGDYRAKNTLVKILVVCVFLLSICFALAAALVRLQYASTYQTLVRDANSPAPKNLPDDWVDYERTVAADMMKGDLRKYNNTRANNEPIFDVEKDKEVLGTSLDSTIHEIGITGTYEIGRVNQRPHRESRDWMENSMVISFDRINRAQLTQFMLTAEDQHFYLSVREFQLKRNKRTDSPPDHRSIGPDIWQADVTLVWFERRERR